VREQDPNTLLVQFGSGAPDVAQILPELQDLFPGLRMPAPSDPEGARFRLFDSMVSFFRTVAQGQPLVLVLDDLQAADAPSLLLLRFVASEMDDARVLIVGLYRDDGSENPQLTSTVAEVARNVAARQISLAGLERSDVARLIETTVDAQVPPALGGQVGAILGTEGTTAGRITPQGVPGTEPMRPGNVFRREGEYWSITFEGETLRLKDPKGLRYLAQLLANPGREFLALEMVTAGRASIGSVSARALRDDTGYTLRRDPGGSDELLDAQATEEYRRRLQELESEIDEAEERADGERAARARDERDLVARELTVAIGIGGRARKAPSDAERARVNVTKAIKAALARIRDERPALWRHLVNTIRTGTFCSYAPDPRVPTSWHV
jgi:hypothetical protein